MKKSNRRNGCKGFIKEKISEYEMQMWKVSM